MPMRFRRVVSYCAVGARNATVPAFRSVMEGCEQLPFNFPSSFTSTSQEPTLDGNFALRLEQLLSKADLCPIGAMLVAHRRVAGAWWISLHCQTTPTTARAPVATLPFADWEGRSARTLLMADSAGLRVSRWPCRVLFLASCSVWHALPAGKSQLLACCWPCRV